MGEESFKEKLASLIHCDCLTSSIGWIGSIQSYFPVPENRVRFICHLAAKQAVHLAVSTTLLRCQAAARQHPDARPEQTPHLTFHIFSPSSFLPHFSPWLERQFNIQE